MIYIVDPNRKYDKRLILPTPSGAVAVSYDYEETSTDSFIFYVDCDLGEWEKIVFELVFCIYYNSY